MIGLAVVLAVTASLSFASGATAQHRGVDKTVGPGGDRRMTARRMLQLVRTPVWLLGMFLIVLGATIHVIALKLAPLTVVQPLGIMAVPFSILLAARLKRKRPGPMIWVAVAITVLGIVGFTYFSTSHASTAPEVIEMSMRWVMTAGVWVWAIVMGFLGIVGPRWLKCLAWAWGGAALYGLGSGFIKILTEIATSGAILSHPRFWFSVGGLATAYAVGGWMIQQAYASGPAEIVVGSMTTVDPLTSVLFGLIVLGEGAAITAGAGIGMFVTGAIACGGVILLSKHHPDAHREYEDPEPATEGVS